MAKQAINTIKQWFLTGKFPTQQQFWDWLDSFRHKDDKVLAADVDGLQTLLDSKVDKKDVAAPEVWDETQAYVYDANNQQYVSYQNPASEDPQFQVEGFYRLLADTAAGESPETHPEKWKYQGFTLGELIIADVLGLQEELDGKIPNSEKGVANGVASLGADGKVPAGQLPATSAQVYDLGFAISDEDSDLTTNNWGQRQVQRACVLSALVFYVNAAPVGSAVTVEVYKNTTLIETITLPAGSTSVTVNNTTAFAIGDWIKAAITAFGSSTPGAGAKLEPKATLV